MIKKYRISLYVNLEADENGLTDYDAVPDSDLTKLVTRNKRALEKIIGTNIENFKGAECEEIQRQSLTERILRGGAQ